MKNKKIFVIIGITILILMMNTSFTRGITTTISTIVEKDSYVDSYSPDSNKGGKDWLIFGDYVLGWNEAYLYFNFSDKPASWTKAEISIDMYSVSETFNVTASLINDTWGEYTIDWLNKPEHREIITTFTVAEGKVYTIDVSNYIEGNGISICLNASDYLQTGYVQARAREGGSSSLFPAPQLIWTYETVPSNQAPTATITSIIPNPAEQGVDNVEFKGTGTDPDGTITAYEWSSSIDGTLDSSKDFIKSANDLSIGQHIIYFRVKDDDGAWSSKVSKILSIIEGGNGNGEPEQIEIPGFNPLILLGSVLIAIPILIKKRKH
jgi:hypothetical protein